MAQQLNLLAGGHVIPTALHTEMQQSYLEYAMSVIVGRALPDVRDGLKPVHRRILYAMQELGLTPDRPFRKCARVVGDVLGKYHPHGDQAVYDALVRMVQDFNSRYPLLAGHGNFGSIDNDPPAAMRYTETRLAPIAQEALLAEIDAATVDFIDNFDNSQQEPLVLPAQLPILLLNGCSGIAVGMATNIPPHNLGEVVDGLIALIDRPNLSDKQLFSLVPGPDFPTGGEIISLEGTQAAYRTGRGSITLRGVTQLETVQAGRGSHRRTAIVVTELPYQVNKAAWVEKVAELVNQGRIEGISDLRDESDREGMRVVVELKREVNPQQILERLYKLTPLQMNFGAILLALVDGQPRQLSLRELLQQFLDFRETTLIRRYTHELQQAETRVHLVEGLLAALEQIDAIIDILRQAPDGGTAKITLQNQFNFSDRQADAVLSMPLRRLTGLEQQGLHAEHGELTTRIHQLRQLLGDRRELLKALKQDLKALKRKYSDPRRTRIVSVLEATGSSDEPLAESTAEEAATQEETVLEFTHRGYVQRRSLPAFQRRYRSQRDAVTTHTLTDIDDFTVQAQAAQTGQALLVLTRQGRAYTIPVKDIPVTTRRSRGTPLVSLLPTSAQGDPETIAAQLVLPENPEDHHLILLTQQGRIKRLPLEEFTNLTGRGLTALKLKGNDVLQFVNLTQPEQQLVLATSSGRLLRLLLDEEHLPLSNRTSQGQPILRLSRREHLVGGVTLSPDANLLLVTARGYGKRLPVSTLRLANRGDLGTLVFQFATKKDTLAGVVPAPSGAIATLLSDAEQVIQFPVETVAFWGKDGPGDRCAQLKRDEQIIAVTVLVDQRG